MTKRKNRKKSNTKSRDLPCLLSYSPAYIQRTPTYSLRLMLMNLLSFNENELKINFSAPELIKTSINDNFFYQLFFKIA